MTANRYQNGSSIWEAKLWQLVKLFALDIEATKIAELTGLSRKTVNRIFYKSRILVAGFCQQQSALEDGLIFTQRNQEFT